MNVSVVLHEKIEFLSISEEICSTAFSQPRPQAMLPLKSAEDPNSFQVNIMSRRAGENDPLNLPSRTDRHC